jgi:acetyl/propionyl-CoA carboxylase alpha subunit
MTTGLDLVREQMRIADGQPLSLDASTLRQTGHALECRIYAEVPEENFRPDTGTVAIFRPPAGPGVRLDSGIGEGSEVGFHYDPMLAKLIVRASSRDAAIQRMQRALSDFVLLGVRNNIEFLRRVISHAEFQAGRTDTHFLTRHAELLQPPAEEIPPAALIVASLAPAKSTAGGAGSTTAFSDVWASGAWRIS